MKKFFFSVLAIALQVIVMAQTPVQSVIDQIQGIQHVPFTQKIIIENSKVSISFSLNQVDAKYEFHREPFMGTTVEVAQIGQYIEIRDLVVFEDTIYFCGQLTISQMGFIAKAGLDIFTSGNHFFYPFNVFESKSVDKIEVYRRSTDKAIQIVAIGIDSTTAQQSFFLCSDGQTTYDIFTIL
ncbi:MAG: hypothetical protein LBR28_03165 [Bacteroidales bacterium]|jgi:hypothetical protein|nr:hypothetical protein [Bacteroidales bacterium]